MRIHPHDTYNPKSLENTMFYSYQRHNNSIFNLNINNCFPSF
nr:MAG TPA: hypothetical protein [Caudoviricetes sp.]